jgi:hypothetical protein
MNESFAHGVGINGWAFDDADFGGAGGIADRLEAERPWASHWYRKRRCKDKHLGLVARTDVPKDAGQFEPTATFLLCSWKNGWLPGHGCLVAQLAKQLPCNQGVGTPVRALLFPDGICCPAVGHIAAQVYCRLLLLRQCGADFMIPSEIRIRSIFSEMIDDAAVESVDAEAEDGQRKNNDQVGCGLRPEPAASFAFNG